MTLESSTYNRLSGRCCPYHECGVSPTLRAWGDHSLGPEVAFIFQTEWGVEKYFRSAVGISLSVLVKVFPHLGGDLEMVTPAPAKMGYVRVCEVLLS